jgi:hypothetical protein
MKTIRKEYSDLKAMLEQGKIKKFEQLADQLPCSALARDIDIDPRRMKKLLSEDFSEIQVGELIKISKILDVDFKLLSDLLIDQIKRS